MSTSYILPCILSLIITTVAIFAFSSLCQFIVYIELDMNTIFTGLFNISAILTGFLLTIYCFISVSSNPFIEQMQGTATLVQIKKFMLTTTLVTFVSSLCSLILSALNFSFSGSLFWEAFAFSIWVFFSCLGISFFLSCLYYFLVLSDDVPRTPVSGG